MDQDRGAAEPRAHDVPIADGWRRAVNHGFECTAPQPFERDCQRYVFTLL
jgi:hypothetical protein